ncbi:cupin domain-containing protein [Halotia wernerae UHCC 0503]|nr:cupin domain-containing protein [Halotia wernerae UHCC 0503]
MYLLDLIGGKNKPMATPGLSLEDLLQPIDLETFLKKYWEQKPLHISGEGRKDYKNIFSIQDLDTLLRYNNTHFIPTFNIIKNGTQVPQMNNPSQRDAFETYSQGNTLLVGSMHNRWKSIGLLCRNFELTLRHPTGATIVTSPNEVQGLSRHFDGVDVFVIQLEGEKYWQIYNPLESLPLNVDGDSLPADTLLDSPLQEVHMRAGDLLYIPRGFPHQAFTKETTSLHLSICVNVIHWKDLIAEVLSIASEQNIELRKSLPIGLLASQGGIGIIEQELHEKLSLLSEIKVDVAIEQLGSKFIKQMQPLSDGHFTQINHLQDIDLDTVLEKRDGMLCYVFQRGNSAEIHFPGGSITVPAHVETALHFIADAEKFTVKNLSGGLSDDSKLVLSRTLVKEGLLRAKT